MSIERCQRCVGGTFQNQVANECLPVDAFGDVAGKQVQVATIGLNPAATEFYQGNISVEQNQRLSMLSDYRISSRADLKDADMADAEKKRKHYFNNPQRGWHPYFEKLESFFSRVQPAWSYVSGRVVHIDLVACATKVRWGDLSGDCQVGLMQNCREYFLATLSKLPNGTLLLLDGKTVVAEMQKLGLAVEKDGGDQRIDVTGNTGWAGKIICKDKTFPFRGWSIPVGRMTPVIRYNLAIWVGGTMRPPLPFLPLSK